MDDDRKRMFVKRTLLPLVFPATGMLLLAVLRPVAWKAGDDTALADKMFTIGFIMLGTLLVHRLVCGLVLDGLVSKVRGRPVPNILRHLIAITLATAALMACTHLLFNNAFSGILAFSGVIGVVVGLALRPIILDVFSGLSTNLDTAFQIGDWVEMAGNPAGGVLAGWVHEINWRTTHIRTRAGNLIIVPNSTVGTIVITNLSRPFQLSRYEVEVRLPPEVECARACRVLQAAVDATLDSAQGPSPDQQPDVLVTGLRDAGVDYTVRFWLNAAEHSPREIRHRVLASILGHLHLAGIPLAETVVLNRDMREIADTAAPSGRMAALARVEIFREVGAAMVSRLAESLGVADFAPGDTLVAQGGEDSDLFVIVEGAVEVFVEVEGTEVRVARMQAGDYFGEMALLTGEPRTASVRAITRGSVYRLGRNAMARLLGEDAALMETLSRNLADRNLNRSGRIEESRPGEPGELRKGLAASLLEKMRRVFRAG